MIRYAVLTAAVLALAACKPAAEGAKGEAGATAAAPAAPTQAAGDWYVTIDPKGHMLDFKATSESPDSELNLACVPGTGALSMAWRNAQPATLKSGAASQDYAAHDAAANLSDPVFAAFKDTGVMEITQGGRTQVLRGSPEGRFAVQAFFQFCNKPA